MLLYHGTSEWAAEFALKDGLQPRRAHGVDNWDHTVSSNPNAVYLTTTYACHFAIVAMMNAPRIPDPLTVIRKRVAVLEIDTQDLVENRLHPDEDALEQSSRGRDDLPYSLHRRTEIYRGLARKSSEWKRSLEILGTCAYYGAIAPRHIKRIAYFKPKLNPIMSHVMIDGIVSVMGFKFSGHIHRNCTRWLFGEPITPQDIDIMAIDNAPDDMGSEFQRMTRERYETFSAAMKDRSAIEVVTLR